MLLELGKLIILYSLLVQIQSFHCPLRPPLVTNLRLRLTGVDVLEPWIPQQQFLGIIGTGDGSAVASKGGLAVEGQEMWKLKDSIDRTWMQGFQEFPDMDEMMKKKVVRFV